LIAVIHFCYLFSMSWCCYQQHTVLPIICSLTP